MVVVRSHPHALRMGSPPSGFPYSPCTGRLSVKKRTLDTGYRDPSHMEEASFFIVINHVCRTPVPYAQFLGLFPLSLCTDDVPEYNPEQGQEQGNAQIAPV